MSGSVSEKLSVAADLNDASARAIDFVPPNRFPFRNAFLYQFNRGISRLCHLSENGYYLFALWFSGAADPGDVVIGSLGSPQLRPHVDENNLSSFDESV